MDCCCLCFAPPADILAKVAHSYPAATKHGYLKMRWCVCKKWGPPSSLVTEDGPPLPQPDAGEVAIAVSACAVNFPDLLVVQVGAG